MQKLILLFILLATLEAFPQENQFRNYTVLDGLPSNTVYCVEQDDQGFMWFGTDAGLSRFDGYSFLNLGLKDGLPDHEIINFFKDSFGRIWMFTINGKVGYIQNSQIFTSANTPSLSQLDLQAQITNVFEKDSVIYISGDGSLKAYNGEVNQITLPIAYNYTYALPYDSIIVIFSRSEMYIYQNDQLREEFSWGVDYNHIKFGIQPNPYHSVLSGHTATMALLNEPYYFTYDFNNKELEFIESKGLVYNLKELVGGYYALTKMGVYYSESADFRKLSKRKYDIPEPSNIHCDVDGNKWITSISNGVFTVEKLSVQSIPIKSPKQLEKVGSSLFIGSQDKKILELNKDSEIRIFKEWSEDYNIKIIDIDTVPMILRSGSVFYDGVNYDFNRPRAVVNEDSIFYIASLSSIKKLNINQIDATDPLQFHNSQIIIRQDNTYTRDVLFMRSDSMIIATDKGLKYFDGDSIIPYETGKSFQIRMTEIEPFTTGVNVIASQGAGLLLMFKDSIQSITTAQGLSSDIVNAIKVHDSIIWVGSKLGLDRLSYSGDKIEIYKINVEDGLTKGQVFDIELFDDKVFVSTEEGLSYFSEKEIFKESNVFPVFIDAIYADNELVTPREEYVFSPEVDDIQINYSAILYSNNNSLKFRHQLKSGEGNNWQESSSREAYYSNLKPGVYRFQLQGKTKNSLWSPLKEVSIIINPPYWQIWWVQMLFVVIIVAISLLIYSRIRKSKDLKEQLDRDKTKAEIKALKSQINPHFLFNALSSIQRFIIKDEKDLAEDYLADYGQLIRKVLDHSNELLITVQEEIETLELYTEMEKLRMNNSFDVFFQVDPAIDPYTTNIPSMIVQPLLENAIWHGVMPLEKKGSISVSVKKEQNTELLVSIEDNGVGFVTGESNTIHKSFGSNLVRERLELLHRYYNKEFKLEIISTPGEGTLVNIKFPSNL